jgi:8-oxo-dGTP pyrophosphatase MutT (NUDIX family)
MTEYAKLFPSLFKPYIPPDGALQMCFRLGTDFPRHLIGTVKMVAYIEEEYIAVRSPSGWWEPGGKPEPGESFLETIHREMLEETGCQVISFTLFGAFHCVSLKSAPPAPGLLWPEFYFLWGYGEVEKFTTPRPTATEEILEIGLAPLEETCRRLITTPGAGPLLVEIYRLADLLRKENTLPV